MNYVQMTAVLFTGCLAAGAVMAQSNAPADDQPMTVNGVQTVCTGTTTDVRADPKWRAYGFHLEVAGKDGQYLGDEKVSVTGNGMSVSVQCGPPWVLMKLPAGSYHVSVDVPDGGHRDLTMRVPGRTVVHFPNGGGEASPPGPVAAQ